MKIYVVRHGETNFNVKNKISGISEAMLTDLGKKQALNAKEKLKDIHFDKVYVSPLQRAIDTANIITNQNKIIDQRIKEIDFGVYEGMDTSTKEFQQTKYNLGVRFPQGETFLEVVHRVYSFLDDVTSKDDEVILVICHGVIIRTINSYFYDMTNDDFFYYRTQNCDIKIYDFKK